MLFTSPLSLYSLAIESRFIIRALSIPVKEPPKKASSALKAKSYMPLMKREILQESNAAPRSFITAKAIGAADIRRLSMISTIALKTTKNLTSMLLKAVTPQKSLPLAINRPQRVKA